MAQKIAVFDIDGTLCSTHLGVKFLKEMAELGAIQGVKYDLFMQRYHEWQLAEDRTAYYGKHFDEYYTSRLKGVDKSLFELAGKKVAQANMASFYPEVLKEYYKHKNDSRFMIIISKSPEQAVAEVAYWLQADSYWGWQFNFDAENRYVDQYTYPNNESDKAFIIKQLVSKLDLSLDDAYAYGDSAGDISMLNLVAHGNAVNPEPDLLSVAKEHGWNIIRTNNILS